MREFNRVARRHLDELAEARHEHAKIMASAREAAATSRALLARATPGRTRPVLVVSLSARQQEPAWQGIRTAPFDRDLELAVIAGPGMHALVFPCRRILRGWVKTATREQIDVRPTHWREWVEET